eukprot:jgi/Chrzof1/11438/Cz05g36210.t1
MLKHVLGLGLQDGGSMGLHHVATISLVLISYFLNLHHLGLVVFALLNVSNPLLHLSKLANLLELKKARVLLFMMFAAAFFFTRVVLFPYVVLKCSLFESVHSIRGVFEYFLWPWLVCNVLLLALCVMQGVWLTGIFRVLKKASQGNNKALTATVDKHNVIGVAGKIRPMD